MLLSLYLLGAWGRTSLASLPCPTGSQKSICLCSAGITSSITHPLRPSIALCHRLTWLPFVKAITNVEVVCFISVVEHMGQTEPFVGRDLQHLQYLQGTQMYRTEGFWSPWLLHCQQPWSIFAENREMDSGLKCQWLSRYSCVGAGTQTGRNLDLYVQKSKCPHKFNKNVKKNNDNSTFNCSKALP